MCPRWRTLEMSQRHNKSSMFMEKCWRRLGREKYCAARGRYMKALGRLKLFDMKNVYNAFFIHTPLL